MMPKKTLFFLISIVSLSGFLIPTLIKGAPGFPLDDAWIHQTYARNLIQYGEWSFLPGDPSGGSTAPLWSLLLSIGYLFKLNPVFWNFVLALILMTGLGHIGYFWGNALLPDNSYVGLLTGVLLIFEWHLLWAALSGMETLAFTGIILLVFQKISKGVQIPPMIGALIGLSVWLRPDGLTLLGPLLVVLILENQNWRQRIQKILLLLGGFALLFLPYILFNIYLTGNAWPNTFFAKQAEYAINQQLPFLSRYWDQLMLPLVGVGVLLLPGFLFMIKRAVENRRWDLIVTVTWFFGYLGIYAWRLPVTYQHGRYVIPAMPIFFVGGLVGMIAWLNGSKGRWSRILGRSGLLSIFIVLIGFWFLGAKSYVQDVAIIESEMVKTARWISENTEPESIIAAHDIGALGYYCNRKILDLAGLISPDVIDFLRDETRLEIYLNQHDADYLVTLEGWYPQLEALGQMIYKSDGKASLDAGGSNIVVYLWKRDTP